MAYNLQPLITILEQILDPKQTRWIVDHNKPQLQSLFQKAVSLQQILDKSPLTKIESLESEIRDAAHKAEDIIESHMVDQMLSNPGTMSLTFSTPDLQQVTQELDSAMEQVVKLIKGKTRSSASSSSGAPFSSGVNSMQSKVVVGIDEDLAKLRDRLMGMQSKLEIVPIVGMGGIGKTTLARKLYEDPSIVSHFQYAHAWSTVSQDYNMKAILLRLLRCILTGEEYDLQIRKESHELKDILYRSLCGRRYIIVLDDVWSIKFWDEMRMYFPDNNKGSRIVITTRESEVAKHADSRSLQHQLQLLNKSDSWNLLCRIVFGEEDCPDFLQGIGEKIARNCGGLPLALNVIGGLLSKVERSEDGWENIATNVASAIAESDKGFSNILSLSYNHLPNHLKPCFLYMGTFREDYEIKPFELIRLWIAEGFVKSNRDKSLEEEAEDYLKALLERNLLLVRRDKPRNGKAKRCSIHDLLRDLCMRKAYEDKFLHLKNTPNVTFSLVDQEERSNTLSIYDEDKFLHLKNTPNVTIALVDEEERSNTDTLSIYDVLMETDEDKFPQFSNWRHVSVHSSIGMEDVYASAKFMTHSYSLSKNKMMILSSFFSELRLIRVLDVMAMHFREFPTEILQLVNLRFLAVSCGSSIPRGISRLWNLRTLIAYIGLMSELPFEIWELSELRHLKLVNETISFEDEYVKQIFCKKLQTISLVMLTCSLTWNAFLKSIPNIKDLGIIYADDLNLSGVVDLSHLRKLEKLRCQSIGVGRSRRFWSTFKFPLALRKLTLEGIEIFPRVSTLLCSLPNLEVLKIVNCGYKRKDEEWEALSEDEEWEALSEDEESEESPEDEDEDEEWEVAEGDEFRSLQFLSLVDLRLKRWRADETNFPRLRHLRLKKCDQLEEIPSGIGEVPTLQLIELDYRNDSVVTSAEQIREVQQSDYGNYDLKLHFT